MALCVPGFLVGATGWEIIKPLPQAGQRIVAPGADSGFANAVRQFGQAMRVVMMMLRRQWSSVSSVLLTAAAAMVAFGEPGAFLPGETQTGILES
jgi:hypothetical protein